MPKRAISTTLLAAALALPAAASAADAKGAFAVRGPGGLNCADYLQAREGETHGRDFLLWLDGYLSALNLTTSNTFDFLPWGNESYLAMLLDSHCRRHRDQPFHVAANKLLEGLHPYRLSQSSPQVEAEHGGAKVVVYAETLKRVQKRLKEKGFYAGPVDGRFSEELAKALARLQRELKLPPTGLPDNLTLHQIFLAERRR